MNIKPLGDNIVVKALEEKEVTASGIVLPDTVDKEKKAEGEVVAIGPGKLLDNGRRSNGSNGWAIYIVQKMGWR